MRTVEDSTVMEPLMTDATYTDKKVGDGHIFHHHRVGVGYSESTLWRLRSLCVLPP